ncbi:MAG TPA: hypothetical protein VFU47_16215 [Armatimonadota bacterium]|nr:hypothetical protein [Armatimonadota bacterium]
MALRKVYERSGTITADGQWSLPALDLSEADQLKLVVTLTGAPAGTSPTLNVRLQSRQAENVWDDRISLAQFTGSDTTGETKEGVIQKFGSLSDTEEAHEPSGSSSSRLAAGTVLNGPFPGPYRESCSFRNGEPGANQAATGWRLDFDIGGTGSPSFAITVRLYSDSAY